MVLPEGRPLSLPTATFASALRLAFSSAAPPSTSRAPGSRKALPVGCGPGIGEAEDDA